MIKSLYIKSVPLTWMWVIEYGEKLVSWNVPWRVCLYTVSHWLVGSLTREARYLARRNPPSTPPVLAEQDPHTPSRHSRHRHHGYTLALSFTILQFVQSSLPSPFALPSLLSATFFYLSLISYHHIFSFNSLWNRI